MSQRLEELKAELGKVFGRYAKWQLRCKEQNARTEAEQIKLAEEVLAEPCTGTVAEARTHSLGLQGVKTIELKDFLGRGTAKVPAKRRRRR
jgi:hypothetical protein